MLATVQHRFHAIGRLTIANQLLVILISSCNLALANTLFSGQAGRRNSNPNCVKPRALCAICKMRKILFLIFLMTLKCSSLTAQISFENEPNFSHFFPKLFQEIDSVYNLEREFDFEIRLWTSISNRFGVELFILSLKNKNWTARCFELSKEARGFLEKPVSQNGLPELWERLRRENILSIPDEDDLLDSIGNPVENTLIDGVIYRFELLSKNSNRSIYYRCPNELSKDYSYIPQLKNISVIINLIYQRCLSRIRPC